MLENISGIVERIDRAKSGRTCILIALLVLLVDFITGKDIYFPILYFLPVGLSAWRGKTKSAYGFAVLLPIVRLAFHFPWQATESIPLSVINETITMVSLILYVFLVDIIAKQKDALEKKVNMLEGILPICASCKKIRNAQGAYEPIEKYITEHSDAQFSHGICQECAARLYPEYITPKDRS